VIQITPQMRLLLAVEPVDFRKGIDGLVQVCRQRLSLTFDTHRLLSWLPAGFLGFPRADGQRSSLQF
jgi:hypothetical protein